VMMFVLVLRVRVIAISTTMRVCDIQHVERSRWRNCA
jgi:hypothetical protein